MDDLRRGKLDPWDLPDPLTLVDWPGRGFITLDHRRAWCLKQYEVGVGRVVCTRARVFRLPANTDQPVNKRPFRVFCATMMALHHAAKLSFSSPS